jgi:hypothetical protein
MDMDNTHIHIHSDPCGALAPKPSVLWKVFLGRRTMSQASGELDTAARSAVGGIRGRSFRACGRCRLFIVLTTFVTEFHLSIQNVFNNDCLCDCPGLLPAEPGRSSAVQGFQASKLRAVEQYSNSICSNFRHVSRTLS